MTWREQGLCWQSEAPDFFPSHGLNGEMARAKAICESCPVIDECLEYALVSFPSKHYDFGVWGGTTPWERQRLRRERTEATGLRTCKRCRVEKPLDDFPQSGSGYRRYDCRSCWSRVSSVPKSEIPRVKVHTASKYLSEDI